MASRGAVLGALVLGFGVGAFATINHVPEPVVKHEVKVIKVPHLITHKEVEVKTVTTPMVLPESCETAMDYMGFSVDQVNASRTTAKKFYDYIDRLDVRKLSDNNAAHESELWLAAHLQNFVEDNYAGLELGENLKVAWDACKQDVQRSLDGDDVTPADGSHVQSP